MEWIIGGIGIVVAYVLGTMHGIGIAEHAAVLHSDCATAHHMAGGFYYIVPESEYVKLITSRSRPSEAEGKYHWTSED